MQIKKIFFIFFEIIAIILLISLNFSYLSLNIIDWAYPDESFQYTNVKNRGLLAAIFSNWCCVSLGRPSATGWIDLWMWIIQIFNINSILVFVFYRLVTFLAMFFSIFYLVKFFLNFLKFNHILILALTFFLIFIQ